MAVAVALTSYQHGMVCSRIHPMNFTTQAAEDILGKLERDPAEIRHWRQLLILCFDQKSIETLQTLQVILAAIEQIWNQRAAEGEGRLRGGAVEAALHRQQGAAAPVHASIHHAQRAAEGELHQAGALAAGRASCFIASGFISRRISTCRNRPRRFMSGR
jgi:hypothetical protein